LFPYTLSKQNETIPDLLPLLPHPTLPQKVKAGMRGRPTLSRTLRKTQGLAVQKQLELQSSMYQKENVMG